MVRPTLRPTLRPTTGPSMLAIPDVARRSMINSTLQARRGQVGPRQPGDAFVMVLGATAITRLRFLL